MRVLAAVHVLLRGLLKVFIIPLVIMGCTGSAEPSLPRHAAGKIQQSGGITVYNDDTRGPNKVDYHHAKPLPLPCLPDKGTANRERTKKLPTQLPLKKDVESGSDNTGTGKEDR